MHLIFKSVIPISWVLHSLELWVLAVRWCGAIECTDLTCIFSFLCRTLLCHEILCRLVLFWINMNYKATFPVSITHSTHSMKTAKFYICFIIYLLAERKNTGRCKLISASCFSKLLMHFIIFHYTGLTSQPFLAQSLKQVVNLSCRNLNYKLFKSWKSKTTKNLNCSKLFKWLTATNWSAIFEALSHIFISN